MNITTIENSEVLSHKDLLRLTGSIGAAVLALSAIAGLSGSFQGDTSAAPVTTTRVHAPAAVQANRPTTVYYLVDTAAQTNAVESAMLQANSGRFLLAELVSYEIVRMDAPDGDLASARLIDAASAAWGEDAVKLVDLRHQ